jgi:hypothetical protein
VRVDFCFATAEQSSEKAAPVQFVLVYSGRLMLDLRDARKQAKGTVRSTIAQRERGVDLSPPSRTCPDASARR